MSFEIFFRSISYAAVFCGYLTLWVTGTFGFVETGVFVAIMVAAWFLEGSRWQIAEKVGTALIVLALPASYGAYRLGLFSFNGSETVIAGILARMILSLSAIKLLQNKSERDWIFLYMMSFFEVLLAAGLSISLSYLASFVIYLLVMVCSVIAFEMRKTADDVRRKVDGDKLPGSARSLLSRPFPGIRRLPVAAVILIAFIGAVAMPLFFMLPRVGGAGLGSFQNTLSTSTGFSDSVTLGGIGRLQQNNAVVMRVKIDGAAPSGRGLYFRGSALDTFDNRSWSRSKTGPREPFMAGDRDLIQLDYATGKENLLIQTVYLEPLDTPVLFSVPRTVAVQGNFQILYKDRYGAVTFQQGNDRISYKVLSDVTLPPVDRLKADNTAYPLEAANYLQLPKIDPRIGELAESVAGKYKSRYDKAVAIEAYLSQTYGYTLEMRSSGSEPVADFLFNVKEGHCEYFASSMALMLRTQGIAARMVTGFHNGEYNDTAEMYVVRQRHAHAWVEVFFPKENVWVPFDPTPAAGLPGGAAAGLLGRTAKYLEALDALWIQYFVAFDNQEQRSLARTLRSGFVDYQAKTGSLLTRLQLTAAEWWEDLRGGNGAPARFAAAGWAALSVVGVVLAAFLSVWLYRRLRSWKGWERFRRSGQSRPSVVDFYERMQTILAEKGFLRESDQTPLEFAQQLGLPHAVNITEKYNEVRFGERSISDAESRMIAGWLAGLENSLTAKDT